MLKELNSLFIKINQEDMMNETKYWKQRENVFLLDSESEINYHNKKQIFSKIGKQKVADFFQKYEHVYFPDIMVYTNETLYKKILNFIKNF